MGKNWKGFKLYPLRKSSFIKFNLFKKKRFVFIWISLPKENISELIKYLDIDNMLKKPKVKSGARR
jgi:hypothetical protein